MVYDIILGRSQKDVEKFGKRGTVLIGKQYIKMGAITSLSSPIYLDMNTAHVMFISGKRGSGKSYLMGAIAEGLADMDPEVKDHLSVILLDTMGVYWSMKYPNHQDTELLESWGLDAKGLPIIIYAPAGKFDQLKKEGIPVDKPFSIRPAELNPDDWFLTFDMKSNEPIAIFIERVVMALKKSGKNFSIADIISEMEGTDEDETIRKAAVNRFKAVADWGVFSETGTEISELAAPGQVVVLDLSIYAVMPGGWKIKSLVLGLIAQKLFVQRMISRKKEEYGLIHSALHYFKKEEKPADQMPIVWLVIDEAHEFLPREGKVASSDALITLLREGRQPGVSLIMATQQPGKIHTDVMTQSDIILSLRLTAKIDIDSLGLIAQSYLRQGIGVAIDNLPRVKGAAIVMDDVNERLYPMRVRPRFTWHGGSAPQALREKKKVFEF